MSDESAENFQPSTAIIVKYGTVLIAPDDCIPPPAAADIVAAEESAVAEYRKMLRRFRTEGLVVIMHYVEKIDKADES